MFFNLQTLEVPDSSTDLNTIPSLLGLLSLTSIQIMIGTKQESIPMLLNNIS
jgi:hypothetical protein